ncbi:MAG: ABC transporter substrate-binding protein [Deltaproteobacteria bacterium]|nr:ABC transporter substrate-binding protein [Deltaproteobacteria bacterium]
MDKRLRTEFRFAFSRKSKIQNLKCGGIVAIVVAVVMCGVMAQAQQPGTEARIGVVGAPEEPRFSEVVGGLKKGMGEIGYAPQSVQILEVKVARRDASRVKSIVEGLVRQRVQLLFLIGSRLIKPAREASAELPIVFITPGDPVSAGLVSSLARPGGNMTAMTFEYPELSGKRLELLKEIAPRVRRVLSLYDPRDPSPRQGLAAAREAAPGLGVTLVERETRNKDDIKRGLGGLGEVDALLAIPGGLPTGHYQDIIHAAHSKKIATMFHARSGSTREALASYGASDAETARQAARLVHKILEGARAGDLPVERPTKLELIINLKTAKQIGLTIPPNVLARADRVIK